MVKLQLISCAKFDISELALPPFPLGVHLSASIVTFLVGFVRVEGGSQYNLTR